LPHYNDLMHGLYNATKPFQDAMTGIVDSVRLMVMHSFDAIGSKLDGFMNKIHDLTKDIPAILGGPTGYDAKHDMFSTSPSRQAATAAAIHAQDAAFMQMGLRPEQTAVFQSGDAAAIAALRTRAAQIKSEFDTSTNSLIPWASDTPSGARLPSALTTPMTTPAGQDPRLVGQQAMDTFLAGVQRSLGGALAAAPQGAGGARLFGVDGSPSAGGSGGNIIPPFMAGGTGGGTGDPYQSYKDVMAAEAAARKAEAEARTKFSLDQAMGRTNLYSGDIAAILTDIKKGGGTATDIAYQSYLLHQQIEKHTARTATKDTAADDRSRLDTDLLLHRPAATLVADVARIMGDLRAQKDSSGAPLQSPSDLANQQLGLIGRASQEIFQQAELHLRADVGRTSPQRTLQHDVDVALAAYAQIPGKNTPDSLAVERKDLLAMIAGHTRTLAHSSAPYGQAQNPLLSFRTAQEPSFGQSIITFQATQDVTNQESLRQAMRQVAALQEQNAALQRQVAADDAQLAALRGIHANTGDTASHTQRIASGVGRPTQSVDALLRSRGTQVGTR
ncbi:MAG: hypothetical protein LC769_07295, partial [Chloroflexi bacterium]|nr:hypothetical protein [Chloroflexota bacterium]